MDQDDLTFIAAGFILIGICVLCLIPPFDGLITTKQGIIIEVTEQNWPWPYTTIQLTTFSESTTYITIEGNNYGFRVGHVIEITYQYKAFHAYDTMRTFTDLGPSALYTGER